MANYFKGDDLRSYFHSFGRAFTAAGQNFLDQAPLKSGHTVATSDVRAEAVPYIDAEFKLEKEFNGVAAGTCILTGEVGSRTVIAELSNILKFYDGVVLSEMAATNGETFQLIDGVVIKDFMDPTDVFDSTGKKTADGYTIKVLDKNNTPIPMSKGWVVDPVNGAVIFEKGKTPANQSFGAIKFTGFAYIGKKVSTVLETLKNTDTFLQNQVNVISALLGGGGNNEDGLNSSLIDIIADITEDVDKISTNLENQISARISGDLDLATTIAKQTQDRISGDILLKKDIDNVSGEIKYVSGIVDNINTNLSSYATKTYVDNQDSYLSSAITGIINVNNTLAEAIAVESKTRKDNDSYISGIVDTLSGNIKVINQHEIKGLSAINVTTSGNVTNISLNLNPNDKILSQSTDGLFATIGLKKVDSANLSGDLSGVASEYYLADKNGQQIPGTDRITIYKDRYLKSASYNEETKKITLEFNLSNDTLEPVQINLSGLVDTYLATDGIDKVPGEKQPDGSTIQYFKIKLDETAETKKYLSVDANGLKLSGIDASIASLSSTLFTSYIDPNTNNINTLSTQLTKEIARAKTAEETITGLIGTSADNYNTNSIYGQIAKVAKVHVDEHNALTGRVKTTEDQLAAIKLALGDSSSGDDTLISKVTGLRTDVNTLSTKLNEETSARITKDNQLSTKIEKIQLDYTTNYATKDELNTEISARIDGDKAVSTYIDNRFDSLNNELSGINLQLIALCAKINSL